MKIKDLIAAIEAKRAAAQVRYDNARTEIDAILNAAGAEARKNLTEQEDARVTELLAERSEAKADVAKHDARIAELRSEVADDERVERDSARTEPHAQRARYDEVARIGAEKRTYSPDTDKRGAGFLADVAAAQLMGDFGAAERLNRHMNEERVERGEYLTRAVGTSAFAGLVIPNYLTDMYAEQVSPGRPLADAMAKHPLPPTGMTVEIARVTTRTTTAVQANQGDAASDTSIDDTASSITVQTNAGQQTASFQAVQRGNGVEGVIFRDLVKSYNRTLDTTLITQATNGLSAKATATTYTDASPTAAELYPKILGAASGVEGVMLGEADVDLAVMHPRRWAWLQKELTSSWPAFSQPGIAVQALGTNNAARYGSGVRGILPNGLVVITDANIATDSGAGTEDEIYIVPSEEMHLWEDPDAPVFLRAEQTKAATLQVLYVIYGYFAYTFDRYGAGSMAKIGGTGLIAPTF